MVPKGYLVIGFAVIALIGWLSIDMQYGYYSPSGLSHRVSPVSVRGFKVRLISLSDIIVDFLLVSRLNDC